MSAPTSPTRSRTSLDSNSSGGDPNSARAGAATRYPSQDGIRSFFENLNHLHRSAQLAYLAPDVRWTVMGTHPCAGHYTSLRDFVAGTQLRIGKILKPPGLKLHVRQIIGGGESPWAVVELVGRAECKNGLPFENCYAWVMRFDEDGTVREVRAYLDSALVKQAIEENEDGKPESKRAPIDTKVSFVDDA